MFTFFETLLNMSLTASVVILAVLLVRLFMKKAPRKFCYLLWLVVAFRLVVPFSFETSLSIFNVGGEMPTVEIPQTGTVETIPEDLPAEEPSVPETVLPEEPQVSAPAVTPPVGTTSLPRLGKSRDLCPRGGGARDSRRRLRQCGHHQSRVSRGFCA